MTTPEEMVTTWTRDHQFRKEYLEDTGSRLFEILEEVILAGNRLCHLGNITKNYRIIDYVQLP